MADLFAPHTLGGLAKIALSHRVVLAPLTRNRASEPNLCPHQAHVEYYAQRSSKGGLLISEATLISPEAMAYPSVPGIWTLEQADAWRRVTDAVHAKGAKIFCQLWHTGRVAHPSYGAHPLLRASGRPLPSVGPSAVPIVHPKTGAPVKTLTYGGSKDHATPRALGIEEIARLLEDYRHAGRMALRAGFDGVELHAAHGYLIDQFLQDGVNQRTDAYGGSVANRCRLLLEAAAALIKVMGSGRVSVRLSPTAVDPRTGRQNHLYFGATSSDPEAVYEHAVVALNSFPLAYLLLSEPRWTGRADGDPSRDAGFTAPLANAKYRSLFEGTLIAAGGFTPTSAAKTLAAGTYDAIAFGRWFISNPDLPARLKSGARLNVYDRSTFYAATTSGGGTDGYTDYPDLSNTVGVAGKYGAMEQGAIGTTLPGKQQSEPTTAVAAMSKL